MFCRAETCRSALIVWNLGCRNDSWHWHLRPSLRQLVYTLERYVLLRHSMIENTVTASEGMRRPGTRPAMMVASQCRLRLEDLVTLKSAWSSYMAEVHD
jgi:hypothetical protein